jgi:hypothetical protein
MRRARSTVVISISLAALGFAVAPASASKPGGTEHGVNRAKLAKKAEKVIEERNGIELRKISRCGPKKRKGRLDFSKWVCEWRAEGMWPGQVPYHCAGKALWKRQNGRWRVERCKNTKQPMAPLLDVPNPHPIFGYNDNWIFHGNHALDLLDQGGGQVARTSLAWWGVEGNQGSYNWYGSDQLYDRLQDRGIKPLWVIVEAPCWAQPNPGGCQSGNNQLRPAPQYYDEMAKFAVAAAKRYPDSVGIEVWNEPNTVADALHQQAPGMPVVSAGLSPHADTDNNAIGFSNFLDKMYQFGAAQQADAIGIHPYPGVGPAQDYIGDVRVYLGKVQNVLAKYNDSATPFWATEFGVSMTGPHAFEIGHQARALTELYDLFRHVNRVDLAVVHRFVEDPGLPGREGGFGVLHQNLNPKPAYCALTELRGLAPPASC